MKFQVTNRPRLAVLQPLIALGVAVLLVVIIYSTTNTKLETVAGDWRVASVWDASGSLRRFGMMPKATFTIRPDGYTRFGKQGMEGVLGTSLCTTPCFVWTVNYLNQRFEISFLGKGTDRLVMIEHNVGSVIVAHRHTEKSN